MNVITAFNGPVTVAVLVPDAGSMAAELDETFVGVAVCSEHDLYVEAVGVRIATGRAIEELGRAMAARSEEQVVTLTEVVEAEAEDLVINLTVNIDLVTDLSESCAGCDDDTHCGDR